MRQQSDREKFGYPRAIANDFRSAIERHRAGLEDADAPWGWKFPRTILMLPFVHEIYPEMKAVHLVRDGRDMAFSRNQNQVRAKGSMVLSEAELKRPGSIRSIKFWARVNVAAARYGGTRIGDGNYLRFRYEDVCSDPGEAVVQLLDFLDCPASRESMRAVATEVVKPSASTRRRRARDPPGARRRRRIPAWPRGSSAPVPTRCASSGTCSATMLAISVAGSPSASRSPGCSPWPAWGWRAARILSQRAPPHHGAGQPGGRTSSR